MAVSLPEGPSYSRYFPHPIIFLPCYPLNDRRKAAHKTGRLSLLLLPLFRPYSYSPFSPDQRLSNIHPNPGLAFFSSLCAENVIWKGMLVQCCTCSKWVHLRCSRHSYRRDGVAARASALQSVDLGFIFQVESYQKTLKNGIYSFPAWSSAK